MAKSELVLEIGNQLPEQLVDNLEVKDSEGYRKYWLDWINNSGSKRPKVKILIKESAMFLKLVAKEEEAEAFWKEVPVAPEHMVKRLLKQNDGFKAIAVNSQLFNPIIDVVKEVKGRVVGVFPENEPGLEANLITSNTSKPRFSFGKAALVIAGVAILIGGLYLTMKFISTREVKDTTENMTVEVTPTPTEIIKEEIDVSKVKIKVVNASGISGKAKEVAEWMEAKGYQEIEIGNLSGEFQGVMVVAGGDDDLGNRIVSDLSEKYDSSLYSEGEVELEENFDALIIYGN